MRIRILAFFLLVSIYGCHREMTGDQKRLQHAEMIVRTHPDSAMTLLRAIHPQKLHAADYARFALCYNEAAWRLDSNLMSDSLAVFAVTYYTKKGEDKKSASAFLFLSKTKREEHDAQASADALIQAETYAEKSHNKRVLGLVCEDKGSCLYYQDADSNSVEEYKKSAAIFHSIHDIHNEIVENMHIAGAFMTQKHYDSAHLYLDMAEKMARSDKDTVLLSSVLRFEGMNLFYQSHLDDALRLLQQSLSTSHDAFDAGKYMNIGWVYLKQKQYQKAHNTLLIALQHHPTGGLEEACYDQLINVAYAQHDLKRLCRYAKQYVANSDSFYDNSLKNSLLGLEKKYHYEQLHNENQSLTIKNQRLILCILVALLLMMISVYFSLRITLKNKKIQLQREQEKVRLSERECILRESIAGKLGVFEKIVSLRTMPNDTPENIGVQFQSLFNDEALKTKQNIQDFINNVDAVYDQFSIKLKVHYPKLTNNDILVCCLIQAGYDISTIVRFLDIQLDSFHMRCHRIRERMALPRKANLAQFLAKFSDDFKS
jgi:tetratricopeptide (TPR) repeat protein